MATLWFVLIAAMLAAYVALDGFDLGAGALHLVVARTDEERAEVLAAIGPFWDGNEVWLIAAGGTLVFAFPALYARSFSGFFLPLTVVLWLFMGRGIALEFRGHVAGRVWRPFWDGVFAVSSALLALFLGAALGNVVRGVPLDAGGSFFSAFFTDFLPRGAAGILDWYTVLVALLSLAALGAHGALWLAMKTQGAVEERSRRAFRVLFAVTAALAALVSAATFHVQPQIGRRLAEAPWGAVFPAAAFAGLAAAGWLAARRADGKAFLASTVFLTGLLASTAFGLYPYVLPSCLDPAQGLTVFQAAAADSSLAVGLVWWIPGMLLVTGYTVFVYRHFAGRARPGESYH